MSAINKTVLEQIYKYFDGGSGKQPHSWEETLLKFIPDADKYKDKVWVELKISDRYVQWSDRGVISKATLAWLNENKDRNINLGEIAGKHSNIYSDWAEMLQQPVIDDKYEIARLVSEKQDGKARMPRVMDKVYDQWYQDEEEDEEEEDEKEDEGDEANEGDTVMAEAVPEKSC